MYIFVYMPEHPLKYIEIHNKQRDYKNNLFKWVYSLADNINRMAKFTRLNKIVN